MYFRKALILLLVLPILLLTISSCNGLKTDSTPEELPEPPANGPETRPTPPAPVDAVTVELSLSHPPKLGETSELICSTLISTIPYDIDPQSLANARSWVEFYYANTRGSYSEARYRVPVPLDEVLVSGELTWEGNAKENRMIELHSTIQLPREGVWRITGYFSGEGWAKPFKSMRHIAVVEDAAVDLGRSYTEEFKSGPFGYLNYFDYGGRIGKRTPDEDSPAVLDFDISKIPSVGEEAVLTCRVISIVDDPDYSAWIVFIRRLEDKSIIKIPGENLLVDGDLEWQGNLKKNEPVEFSATIILPEEGDWQIEALGDHPSNDSLRLTEAIRFNITSDRRSFGWEDYPVY